MKTSLVAVVVLLGVGPIGCPRPCSPTSRALPIPAAASRSADLVLPLSPADRGLALVYLDDKTPPRGRWDTWPAEEIAAEVAAVSPETQKAYGAILDALSTGDFTKAGLGATGRLGALFDPPGARPGALDSRLTGQILAGDLLVGRLHDHYFVFYRRYPTAKPEDAVCAGETYCRLVIVDEVATRSE